MQPLVSPVDHESRQGSHRAVDHEDVQVSDGTPLLRFPRPYNSVRNPVTTAVVSVLLIILIAGVIIGIYLLILQDKSENILPPVPPVDTSHSVMSQSVPKAHTPLLSLVFNPTKVIVVQTNTQGCNTTVTCEKLIQQMKINDDNGINNYLPYNFLVSSDGHRYTELGWDSPSSLFPEYSKSALVLAFIGNFSTMSPTHDQLVAGDKFILESTGRLRLNSNLTVIGKKTKDFPKNLFLRLNNSSLWNSELSDKA